MINNIYITADGMIVLDNTPQTEFPSPDPGRPQQDWLIRLRSQIPVQWVHFGAFSLPTGFLPVGKRQTSDVRLPLSRWLLGQSPAPPLYAPPSPLRFRFISTPPPGESPMRAWSCSSSSLLKGGPDPNEAKWETGVSHSEQTRCQMILKTTLQSPTSLPSCNLEP